MLISFRKEVYSSLIPIVNGASSGLRIDITLSAFSSSFISFFNSINSETLTVGVEAVGTLCERMLPTPLIYSTISMSFDKEM